LNVVILLSKKG